MAVEDLRDTRVLIPRVRRALEGPTVTGSATSTLTDDMANGVIADAVSNVILLTGGLFGHTLEVVERDAQYMAPISWLVDPSLSEAEASVIVAQAALDYFLTDLKGLKVSETIRDEAHEWSYQLSANALNEWLRTLRAMRDRALEQIDIAASASLDAWESFIEARDATTSALIEPWVAGRGGGGQLLDPRGFD